MKEDIKDLIDDEFSKVDYSLEEIYKNNTGESIDQLVEEQNQKAKQIIEEKIILFDALEKIKETNPEVEYNESMTNEELKEIIEKFLQK